eukprot:11550398-Prorocentrum_lima.AAC.1
MEPFCSCSPKGYQSIYTVPPLPPPTLEFLAQPGDRASVSRSRASGVNASKASRHDCLASTASV